jgi:putative ABC transport system permease protein
VLEPLIPDLWGFSPGGGTKHQPHPFLPHMGTTWQDVRQGFRGLVKNPAFTFTIILTLGLGIGANAAVFSIVNTLLLRPLPVADPHNLFVLGVRHDDNEDLHGISWPDYVDYRDRTTVFSDMTAYAIEFAGLSVGGRADRIAVSYVTGNFFTTLGIAPGAGRLILPAEGSAYGADPVIVLGRSYWKKRFNGDAAVVGQQVRVDGRPFTVIGIVPEGFYGAYALVEFDAYMPFGMTTPESAYREALDRRDNHQMRVLARLKPGVTFAQAQAAVDVLSRQLEQQYPETNKTVRARLIPENRARPEPNAADSTPFVAGVFLMLVGLVLLVACVNVVNLLMVRATGRHRELAVRAALGAGRARLVRQLLTESLLLAAGGALAGALVGRWVSAMLAGLQLPADLPLRFDLSFDWRVFAYIAAIALGTGVSVGLLPALRASRTDLNDALRQGGRSMADGGSRQRMRSLLVIGQVAVSLVLLIAAALFVRSVQHARSVDLGFDHAQVLNLSMDVSQLAIAEREGRAFYRELESRVLALPGVESASYAFSVPFGYYSAGESVEAEGQPPAVGDRRPSAGYNMVGPDYFRTMKVPLVKGRAFTAQDDERARPVAIVNEMMAERFWPGLDPIGKRFRMAGTTPKLFEVVGVSRTGKYSNMFGDPQLYFFAPLAQNYLSLRVLHVRTTGSPDALAPLVEKEIRALNPDLPVFDVRSMTKMLEGPNGFFLLQMGALFGAGLGVLGLVLALVGIYGVVSYAANQRRQEIGVRMALGAQRTDILRLVIGQGLLLVGIGIAVGLAGAFGVSRLLSSLLFGIPSTDLTTFIAVPLVLGSMALLASYLPALRATRVSPISALRQD